MLGVTRCFAPERSKKLMNASTFTPMFAHADRGHAVEETWIMHMALETKRWTRGDLEHLPDDGNMYEVVHGELFVTPAPRARHQQIVVVLARIIGRYVDAHGLGDIHQARSVLVFEGSEVEPDIMVKPKVSAPPPEWESAPTPFLVVEVLSDTTRRRDRIEKRGLYLEAGVDEYWIVDGERRSITVIRPEQSDEELSDWLHWHPAGAPVPLEMDVAAMFRDALG
jgi:Uma2 family endonuclease